MNRSNRVWGPSLALAVLLLACASPQAGGTQPGAARSEPAAPKRVVAAILGDPHTVAAVMNPAGLVAGISEIHSLLHAGLTSKDAQGDLRPLVAEVVPTLENGLWKVAPDGRMETIWKLRAAARWQDAIPFTSDDLVFSARLARDRALPLFRFAAFEQVEAFEAPDPQTLVVKWSSPYISADSVFSRPWPKHLLEKAYLEDKENLNNNPYWTDAFIGLGPFQLKEWVRGSYLVMEAFDSFVLGRPKLDEIEVKFILDPNVLLANLRAGALDMMLGRGISIDQAVETRNQWREGTVTIKDTSWVAIYPQLLTPNPPMVADVQFRRALISAIDRQAMVDSIQHGLSAVAHSWISQNAPEYKEIESSIVRYDFDPRRAIQIIEALGFIRGTDGAFRDAAGQRLTVELRAIAGYDIHMKSQLAVADAWQKIGVEIENVVVPNQRVADREYLANMPAFELRRQGNSITTFSNLHGPRAPVPENNYVGNNIARYRNPEFDLLNEQYLATIPPPERMGILRSIVRHVTENLLWMGLVYDTEPVLIGNRVGNATSGNQTNMTWNAYEWDVRR